MSFSQLLKWLVIVAIVFLAWKYGIPWVKQHTGSTKSAPSRADDSCVGAARAASEAWGSGIHQFVNPPYDTGAWSSFRSGIDSKIAAAESACGCSTESCTKGQSAMRDLRSLVSDLDTVIRTGAPPPGDIVQRQESVDRQIDEAQDLVRSGK
jgi:hypothetical protein